jgi:hypothetical protein
MLTLKATTAWLAILVCAILNGALREGLLLPLFGKPVAPALSGVLLSIIILAIAMLAAPWFGRPRASRYAYVGAVWLLLTLAFEFTFGRLVQNQSWRQMLDAYTFKDGNIWPLVLVVAALAPWLSARIRGLVSPRR